MTALTTNFLGIPIEGDIHRPGPRSEVVQRPAADLHALLSNALDIDGVEAVRWTQYTPYFNDGDECVFGTGEVYFKIAGAPPTAGDYGDGFVAINDSNEGPHSDLVGCTKWDSNLRKIVTVNSGNPYVTSRLSALSSEIKSGVFDDVLIEHFGDHATVTAEPGKITVDYYEHE